MLKLLFSDNQEGSYEYEFCRLCSKTLDSLRDFAQDDSLFIQYPKAEFDTFIENCQRFAHFNVPFDMRGSLFEFLQCPFKKNRIVIPGAYEIFTRTDLYFSQNADLAKLYIKYFGEKAIRRFVVACAWRGNYDIFIIAEPKFSHNFTSALRVALVRGHIEFLDKLAQRADYEIFASDDRDLMYLAAISEKIECVNWVLSNAKSREKPRIRELGAAIKHGRALAFCRELSARDLISHHISDVCVYAMDFNRHEHFRILLTRLSYDDIIYIAGYAIDSGRDKFLRIMLANCPELRDNFYNLSYKSGFARVIRIAWKYCNREQLTHEIIAHGANREVLVALEGAKMLNDELRVFLI